MQIDLYWKLYRHPKNGEMMVDDKDAFIKIFQTLGMWNTKRLGCETPNAWDVKHHF